MRFTKVHNFLLVTKYLMLNVWGVYDTPVRAYIQIKKHEDCFVLFYNDY